MLERLRDLVVPTLVIAGDRDPLVNFERVGVFSGLPSVDVVKVQGAHVLNYSHPEIVAALIDVVHRRAFPHQPARLQRRCRTGRRAVGAGR